MKNLDYDVILVDLDSTVYDTRHRHHLAPTHDRTKTWADYAGACLGDVPFEAVVQLIRRLWAFAEIHIISGRDGSALEKTLFRLKEDEVPYDAIKLRGVNDETPNVDIKVAYIRELRAAGRNVALAFDDWPETCEGIQAEGVPVLCVGNSKISEPDGTRGGV